jgi:hypothetical protein
MQSIQNSEIEMSPLNSQHVAPLPTVVYVPRKATCSNWLKYSSISIAVLGIAAIGATVCLTSSIFNEKVTSPNMASNDTSPFTNQSTASLWDIYKYVEETDFTQCGPAFTKHWKLFESCGPSVCDCVRNARDVFEKYCSLYAQGILPSYKCQDVANVIQRCKEFMSTDYSGC